MIDFDEIDDISDRLDEIEENRNRLLSRRSELKNQIQNLDDIVRSIETAQGVFQSASETIQSRVHDRLSAIVSRALSDIFDDPYEFNILFERKRGKTEAKIVLERDGMQIDPVEAAGGGVADVIAFALRVASMLMHQPPLRRLICADEALKFVSKEYRQGCRSLIDVLSDEFNVQFITVTHDPVLTTGKVIST